MITQQIALVRETKELPIGVFLDVAAALQKQVTRDFAPLWNIDATVSPFDSLEAVPLGYWRVLIVDDNKMLTPGVHETNDGKPFSLITYREDDWDTLASHEVLEMLADPSLNRRVPGDSPHPQQGRVEFLVEVCDPCQDEKFGYSVNGRWMSDFYTPSYFDPVAAPGVRYSFHGSITEPRQVLPGGYLSWRVPETGQWWMKQDDGTGPEIVPLPAGAIPSGGNLRGKVDQYVAGRKKTSTSRRSAIRTRVRRRFEKTQAAMKAEAKSLRSEIDGLMKRSGAK